MRWPSTQTINEKSTNPNGINNALFDLLSKLNTTYQELSNVPRVVDSDTYGRYREYPDGTTQGRTLESSVVQSAAVALTSTITANVATLTVPRGSWMFSAMGVIAEAAATTHAGTSNTHMAISRTSATLPASDTNSVPTDGEVVITIRTGVNTTNWRGAFTIPPYRVDLDEDTTFYFVANDTFAVSTSAAIGWFQAVSIL